MLGAMVMVQISAGAEMSALHKELHGVQNAKEVYFLAGPTDAICHVEAQDMDSLMSTIVKLRSIKGVASTDTRIIVPIH